jgi:GNAT superfamily N-acetyltransferase
MPDMLVRLYDLPSLEQALAGAARHGVTVRRVIAPEKPEVVDWVRSHFTFWAAEVETAFAQVPATCFVAIREPDILGFACYDVTSKNFFGPEGVLEAERGKGIGRALLLSALHAQRAQGYAYSIIGGVGPAEFYAKAVGAVVIADSTPGIYDGMLMRMPSAARGDP